MPETMPGTMPETMPGTITIYWDVLLIKSLILHLGCLVFYGFWMEQRIRKRRLLVSAIGVTLITLLVEYLRVRFTLQGETVVEGLRCFIIGLLEGLTYYVAILWCYPVHYPSQDSRKYFSGWKGLGQMLGIFWLGRLNMLLWVILLSGILLLGRPRKRRLYYRLRFTLDGQLYDLLGKVDTGNTLQDPFTGKPVHILSSNCLRLRSQLSGGIRYIPYRTVGNKTGILPAIRVEQVSIVPVLEKQPYSQDVVRCEDMLFAISKEDLSSKGEYHILLHSSFYLD